MSDTADLRPSIKKKRQVKLPSSLPPVPCPQFQFPVPSSLSQVPCPQFAASSSLSQFLSPLPCPKFPVPSLLSPVSCPPVPCWRQGTWDRELGTGNWGQETGAVCCPQFPVQFPCPSSCPQFPVVLCPQFAAPSSLPSTSLSPVPCSKFPVPFLPPYDLRLYTQQLEISLA